MANINKLVEICIFCDTDPCSCSGTKTNRAAKKKSAKQSVTHTHKVYERSPISDDSEITRAIRVLNYFGMLSQEEVEKHKDKLKNDLTGKLLKYLN